MSCKITVESEEFNHGLIKFHGEISRDEMEDLTCLQVLLAEASDANGANGSDVLLFLESVFRRSEEMKEKMKSRQ